MSPEAERIREMAWQLDFAERWKLARELLCDAPPQAVTDEAFDPEAHGGFASDEVRLAWEQEINRRIDDAESGRSNPIPWEQVRREIRGIVDDATER